MASIMERIGLIVRSNVTELAERMEDPEKVISQTIADAMVTLTKLRQESGEVFEGETQALRQVEALSDEARRWHNVAKRALAAGNEADARTALSREVTVRERLTRQQGLYDQAHEVAETFRRRMTEIEDGIRQLQAKMALVKAKEATVRATEAATQVASDADVLDQRDQAADWQLAEAEGKAEAQRVADDPFAALEAEVAAGRASMADVDDAAVDAALAALRDQLGEDD